MQMAINIPFWEISKLRKLIISLLLSGIMLGGRIAFAELLPCEVGDFSKGDWERVPNSPNNGFWYVISPDTDKLFPNYDRPDAMACCPEQGCPSGSEPPCNIPACTYENARYQARLRGAIGTYWGMSCQQEDIYKTDPLTGLQVLVVKKCHSVGDCTNKALAVYYNVYKWVCKENPPISDPDPVQQFGPPGDICRE